jgi:hypothetical protein
VTHDTSAILIGEPPGRFSRAVADTVKAEMQRSGLKTTSTEHDLNE